MKVNDENSRIRIRILYLLFYPWLSWKHIKEYLLIGDLVKIIFNTLQYCNILKWLELYSPADFYEQLKHIRGPQTNFTFSLLPLNILLATLKTYLSLKNGLVFSSKSRGKWLWRHLVRGAFWNSNHITCRSSHFSFYT